MLIIPPRAKAWLIHSVPGQKILTGAPSSLHGTFRHPSSSVWMHLSTGTRENVLLHTHSLPFILLFPHSLNPTLFFSVSLIFTLLSFTNTDSFLVGVLGHVFLCYPAASSRWDYSRYISDKSKQIIQPCIAYITQDTLHHNVSTIFVLQAMLKCNLFNVLQWPIFPAQHLRNTFTSTFVCCSHQETCVTPAEFILSCKLTCSSLIG